MLSSQYPKKYEKVIAVGQSLSMVWENFDLSNINVYFIKDSTKLFITNKIVSDGQNKHSIFIDNSFFSPEYLPCRIRIEMKDDVFVSCESDTFKVLREIEASKVGFGTIVNIIDNGLIQTEQSSTVLDVVKIRQKI